jgi:hypothetical protein
MYSIRVTISEREHNEDREFYRQELLSGRFVFVEDGVMSPENFANLSLDEQNQFAEYILGDEWDNLWLYTDGAEGMEPECRARFSTRAEAEAVVAKEKATSDSTYEIIEEN